MSDKGCHKEECRHRAVIRFFVRWTPRHQHFNVWQACECHMDEVGDSLTNGRWSGGVLPTEFRSEQIGVGPCP